MKSQYRDFKKLIFILNISKWDLFKILAFILVASAIELLGLSIVIPFIGSIFDLTSNSHFEFLSFTNFSNEDLQSILLILLILIFLLKTLISIFIKWYIGVFSAKQKALLQKKLISLYQNMDYEDYIAKNNSEYVRNIREIGSDCLSNLDMSLKVFADTIIFFFIVCFLALINFKVLLIVTIISFLILFIYQYLLRPISIRLGEIRNKSIGNIHRYIDLGIKGMKETKVLKKDNFFTKNLFNYANIITNTQKKAILIHDSPKHILEFLFLFVGIIFIYYLNATNQDIKLYFPIIGVYLIAAIRLLPSISFIISSLNRVAGLYSSTNIIYNDLVKFSKFKNTRLKNLIEERSNYNEIESIQIKDVSFTYKNSKVKVFEKINFIINKNECVGIIGESGSGKTTFVDILLGLLRPSSGEIFVNNKKLSDEFNLYDKIGYLPQEPIILEDTIKTNISLENDENRIDHDKISEVIKQSNLQKVISNFPKGLNTLIGENGVRLSGGQNKRLALARTFYHGKKFIIMDEATNSLDINTENYIANEIKNIKGKLTIVIISHSRNILKHCDKIFEVKDKFINLSNERI